MEMLWPILGWIAGLGLVIAGVVGAVLPILPGPPLVLCGLWLIALVDGYQRVGGATLIVLGLIVVLTVMIDFIGSALGAKRAGASPQAITGALAGSVVGVFLGIPGLLFGPFVGAVVGELIAHRKLDRAASVGAATWLGIILGSLAKLALTVTMIAIFVVAYIID